MENSSQEAIKISRISILVNLLLSVGKLAAGLLAHSGAMISDREHPYGHERMECVAAILLSGILLATGLVIGWEGIQKILSERSELQAPGVLAAAAALVSILVKELLFRYVRGFARKLDSTALMAEAWHHRSDALSSIGALAGILGARAGFPVLDPLASVVICGFIAKAAADIFRDAVDKMVDHSCDEETEDAIRLCAVEQPEVERIDLLKTREFGNRIYIEMEISVNGDLPLRQAHDAAERVHDEIERRFPKVKHIMIHVNPVD